MYYIFLHFNEFCSPTVISLLFVKETRGFFTKIDNIGVAINAPTARIIISAIAIYVVINRSKNIKIPILIKNKVQNNLLLFCDINSDKGCMTNIDICIVTNDSTKSAE